MELIMDWCLALFHQSPVLMLFTVMGLGYVIGNIRLAGFALGPVTGVLFAGIFFGHYGVRISPAAQSLGFALFIFSVGYQAGPRFFSALRADGIKYFALALVVAVTAVVVTLTASRLLSLQPGMAAGLLAGGLTSSPTLAAAQDAVRQGSIALPSGFTPDQLVGNISTAYAITYIFGLTGLISIIRYMPRLLGIDLQESARELEQAGQQQLAPVNISTRCYRVNNETFTHMTILEIKKKYCQLIPVAVLIRDGEEIELKRDNYLQIGDIVQLIAPRAFFSADIAAIGEEVSPDWDIAGSQDTVQVVVTNKAVFEQQLGQLTIAEAFGVIISHITRAGVYLPHSYDLVLQKGDVLTVTGFRDRLNNFGQYMGYLERDASKTDMITFAFGIVAGILLGMLSVQVAGIAIGLGTAGGLLASGLTIGYLRSVRPTFGRLPEAASWLLMEFGLLLFMTGVGLRAGGNIIATVQQSGPLLIVAGICVTVIPLLAAFLFGRLVLRLNPAILMGALTGAMTSGASLSVVTAEAKSAIPAIGYAGTYAFGNVLLMVAGPVVILLG